MPRVMLADDHPIMLCALQSTLLEGKRVTVDLAVHGAAALLDEAKKRNCDIIVTDYSMPSTEHDDGWTMLERLRRVQPRAKIIVNTAYDNPGLLLGLDRLGMDGILSKRDATSEMNQAVAQLLRGKTYRSTRVRELLSTTEDVPAFAGLSSLSRREMAVTGLVLAGYSVTNIATLLSRSIQTVSSHKCSAKQKLDVASDSELFNLAFSLGILIRPPIRKAATFQSRPQSMLEGVPKQV